MYSQVTAPNSVNGAYWGLCSFRCPQWGEIWEELSRNTDNDCFLLKVGVACLFK